VFQRHLVLAGFVCFLSFAVAQTAPTDAAPDGSQTAPLLQAVPQANAPSGTSDPQHNAIASTWIWQAEFRLRSKDLEGASQSLAKARQLNDQERNLWLVTGDLEWRRGQMHQAIDDYKKEAALYPNNSLAYERLAAAYLHEQDWNEAIAEERKWAEASPQDAMPRAALGYALISTEQYSEAAVMYQQAVSLNKTPDMWKVKLSRAQLRSGQVEMGKATLEALLADSKDAAVLNGAAYELGDADLDLPAAETAAHKAVAMVSDRSAAAGLGTATDSDLAQMPLLAESWDTLGWILFKEHRLSEAENYVRSAWLLGNHDEVGLHLGRVYEAEGKKSEAIATYRMAAGLIASPHPWPYYAHMREMLLAKVAALEGGMASMPAGANSSAAVELRTYTIPNPVNGTPATAEFSTAYD